MTYIANKPVRFDKNYAIGEVIPNEFIEPRMEKRLVSWGKIIKIQEENKQEELRINKGNKKNSAKKE